MSFVDLEKAFDSNLVGNVQAWNRQVAGVPGLVYVHGREKQSKNWRWIQQPREFGVGVGVHHGSALCPLLFIIVLEGLSREFCKCCPRELLYADDLMISAVSMEELLVKLKTWKTEMKKKCMRVNIGKTNILVSGMDLVLLNILERIPVVSVRKE